MTNLPGAMLLDLDDTILAFSASAGPCWRSVCERFAPRVDGVTAEALLSAIDEARGWFWADADRHRRGRLDLKAARREIVAAALSRLGVDRSGMAGQIADTYAREREQAIQPMPGAIEALRRLRAQGVRLALVTNGTAREQRSKIARFGLAAFFQCMVIEGEFGVGKPDPRVYIHALQQLGAHPEEAWMVGDHLEWDVGAPQRLGIRGIWLDHAARGLPPNSPARPDRIVHALSELV